MLRWLSESIFGARPPRPAQPAESDAAAALQRGLALHNEDRFQEAADAYRRALALDAAFPGAHELLGRALASAGDHAGAVAALDTALEANPTSVLAHCVRALALLALGDYPAGWSEYEWRWQREDMQAIRNMFRQEWWNGSDVRGRTLLLFAEQGFGDAIQFVRFAPVLALVTGARIALDCHPPLKALFAGARGVAEVLESDADIPRYELCLPLMSVPRMLGTTVENFSREVPYLQASSEHASKWRQAIAATRDVRVGLVWASNPSTGYAWRKSLPLETLAPLARVPGVALYSLQTDAGEHAAQLPGMKLIDLTAELRDFSETAGLIANLDLVISVDTAVAHLAGAMGKPTWTLLRHVADWRWQMQGEQSLWYPTMRLFRQPREGDWDSLVPPLVAALREFAVHRA